MNCNDLDLSATGPKHVRVTVLTDDAFDRCYLNLCQGKPAILFDKNGESQVCILKNGSMYESESGHKVIAARDTINSTGVDPRPVMTHARITSDPAYVLRAHHGAESILAGKSAYVNHQAGHLLIFDASLGRVLSRLAYGALQPGALAGPPSAKATPAGFEFWIWSDPPPACILAFDFAAAAAEHGGWSRAALEPPQPSCAGRSKAARRALRAAFRDWLPPGGDGRGPEGAGK